MGIKCAYGGMYYWKIQYFQNLCEGNQRGPDKEATYTLCSGEQQKPIACFVLSSPPSPLEQQQTETLNR
jgi:hypothetical protein